MGVESSSSDLSGVVPFSDVLGSPVDVEVDADDVVAHAPFVVAAVRYYIKSFSFRANIV